MSPDVCRRDFIMFPKQPEGETEGSFRIGGHKTARVETQMFHALFIVCATGVYLSLTFDPRFLRHMPNKRICKTLKYMFNSEKVKNIK